ncbi:MAG: DinB family protein [Ginsengibacter sp.]
MKQLLQRYSSYNVWANEIITGKISQLPAAVVYKEMNSSFGTIYKTVVHLMDVESIWWQRLKLQEHVKWPGINYNARVEILSKDLLSLSMQWDKWVFDAEEEDFIHVFEYRNSKKKLFRQPVYEMLLHLFNHQTFHRGQIITMMRQNAVEKIPATDFIVYSRNL